jgi:hypothetical protein
VMETPRTYLMGERWNPKTGEVERYDPKPRVEVVDRQRGLVHLTWVGYDGTQKTIVYQRPDAIDVVVRANATKLRPGTHLYTYDLGVLPSSGADLCDFVPQAFAEDIEPVKQADRYSGTMSARAFSIGRWTYFGALSDRLPPVSPGKNVTFQLRSSATPGLVECRASGGPLSIKGVGEEMPQELEAQLLRHEAWPHGFTIGPDDRLKALSPAQRAAKLVEWLPEFERQGWITAERRRHYEASARRGDVKGLAGVVDPDLRAEQITTEVRAIVVGLADLLGK